MSKVEKEEEEESGDVGVCGSRGSDRPRVWAVEWDVDIILGKDTYVGEGCSDIDEDVPAVFSVFFFECGKKTVRARRLHIKIFSTLFWFLPRIRKSQQRIVAPATTTHRNTTSHDSQFLFRNSQLTVNLRCIIHIIHKKYKGNVYLLSEARHLPEATSN